MTNCNLVRPIAADDAALAPPLVQDLLSTRRGIVLASLLAALPLGLINGAAKAIDASETQVTLSDQYRWKMWTGGPPHSAEIATLYGALDQPGPYVVLMKWYPGYMSAPHTYVTDRLCFVLSGTWWVNSGDNFRSERHGPSAGGWLRPTGRAYAALRRRQEGRCLAGRHRDFWHRPGRYEIDRPDDASVALRVALRRGAPEAAFTLILLERAKGFEPSTPTLARLCSTPELHPHPLRSCRARLYAANLSHCKLSLGQISSGRKWHWRSCELSRRTCHFLRRCDRNLFEHRCLRRGAEWRKLPNAMPGRERGADQGDDDGDLRRRRPVRIRPPACARRFLGALVRALQASSTPVLEKVGQSRRRKDQARHDEHRRASADRRPARRPLDPRRHRFPEIAAGRWLHRRIAREPDPRLCRAAWSARSADEDLRAEAEAAFAGGDVAAAAEIFAALIDEDPNDLAALGGLIKSSRRHGRTCKCRNACSSKSPRVPKRDPAIAAARAALENAVQAAAVGDVAELARRVASEPTDHQARYDLAIALNAHGQPRRGGRCAARNHQTRPRLERWRRPQAIAAILRGLGQHGCGDHRRPTQALGAAVFLNKNSGAISPRDKAT